MCSSMKLRRSAWANVSARSRFSNGAVTEATTFLLRYQATIEPSPLPVTLTLPTSSTWQTV